MTEEPTVREQEGRRYRAAAESSRRHGEDRVIGRYGSDAASVWALKSLGIAAVVATLGFFIGGWSTAVILFVVWALSAVALRVYAKRLQNRRASGD